MTILVVVIVSRGLGSRCGDYRRVLQLRRRNFWLPDLVAN